MGAGSNWAAPDLQQRNDFNTSQASLMAQQVTLTYYSDILCIWAHISQVRIDEVSAQFAEKVQIDYRFCSVFGDTANHIGVGWADRGGFTGYAEHVHNVATEFGHINLHPEIWRQCRPASSTPAHLFLKAVQRIDGRQCRAAIRELRAAFFERCLGGARGACCGLRSRS